MNSLIDVYESIGYQCLKISATTNLGIDELKMMIKDKTKVFSGQSGVGQSAIINCIQPGAQ
jgi:ribosome biogenesis GTPase